MTTTLVTGASGFVGTHLMREMLRLGLPARGVTRNRQAGLVTVPSYGPHADWREILVGIDSIVHLAARVHVMHETAPDPLALFREANVEATLNLARQAAKTGVRRFVFVSSIKVNGEITARGKPFTEADPRDPRDPYAVSKAEAEMALLALGRESRMEVVIIRPPIVYGPGVRGNFRSLMKLAARGFPSVFPLVNNRRTVAYVGNLCSLIGCVLTHPDAVGETLFAGDAEPVSTHELYMRLATAYGRSPVRLPVPALVRCT